MLPTMLPTTLALATDASDELLRYLFVLVSAPVWVPFLKALWKELERAIRADGGFLGAPPSARRRAEIEREIAKESDPLIHEPIANRRSFGGRRRPATSAPQRTSRGTAPSTRPVARASEVGRTRRRGFR